VTFSIVARDSTTGDLGAAVQSKFLAVGAICIDARVGAGAIASQALSKTTYRTQGMEMLAAGEPPDAVLASLLGTDPLPERRQVGMVSAGGQTAAHTGKGCMQWAGHVSGPQFSCQGNGLVSSATVEAMARAMEETTTPFPERLVDALAVGQAAGGDARGQQSAALLVVRPGGGYGGEWDRMIDLRVDDHATPIDELGRLLQLHRLYFDKPTEAELRAIDDPLAREIAEQLARLEGVEVRQDDLGLLWDRLERWAGRENVEERMVKRGYIDVTVLRLLREAGGERS
jgi:uncharacterized Ntn-hydrolase superfamily protein